MSFKQVAEIFGFWQIPYAVAQEKPHYFLMFYRSFYYNE